MHLQHGSNALTFRKHGAPAPLAASYTTPDMRPLLAFLVATLSLAAVAQQTPPVTAANPDGSITFRYSNAGAQQVMVDTDATPKPLPMTKGENGIWTATTPPLKPEHYGYSFRVEGVQRPAQPRCATQHRGLGQ